MRQGRDRAFARCGLQNVRAVGFFERELEVLQWS